MNVVTQIFDRKKIFRLFHSHISSISPFSSFYRRKGRFSYPLYTSTGADYWLLNQWNPYPFWGEPPPIGHDREYPPGIHDKLSHTKNTPFDFYIFFSPCRQTVLHFIFKFLPKRLNIINSIGRCFFLPVYDFLTYWLRTLTIMCQRQPVVLNNTTR